MRIMVNYLQGWGVEDAPKAGPKPKVKAKAPTPKVNSVEERAQATITPASQPRMRMDTHIPASGIGGCWCSNFPQRIRKSPQGCECSCHWPSE